MHFKIKAALEDMLPLIDPGKGKAMDVINNFYKNLIAGWQGDAINFRYGIKAYANYITSFMVHNGNTYLPTGTKKWGMWLELTHGRGHVDKATLTELNAIMPKIDALTTALNEEMTKLSVYEIYD